MADALRTIGYKYSTRAGLSLSLWDMIIPEEKVRLLDKAEEEVKRLRNSILKVY